MRTKNSLLNVLFSLINKMFTVFFGFIVVKLILLTYGSSANGMIASIRELIRYLSLVEMGIAGASIYALYAPLASKNYNEVGKILLEAQNYYKKSGVFFVLGIFLLSVIYPFVANSPHIQWITIFLIFIILSFGQAIDFFAFAKYKLLFISNQKEYVVNACNTIYLITYSLLAIIVIKLNYSIVVMQSMLIFAYAIRSLLLYSFFKRAYGHKIKSIKKYSILNGPLIKQKESVMWHEIALLTLSATPLVVMTLFYELKNISVYAVYNMVISNIFMVIATFNSAFTASFGNLLNDKNYYIFSKLYNQFEFIYYSLVGCLFLCTLQLIQPFVNLYTKDITDVTYNNKILMLLMLLVGLANSFRVPTNIIIGIAGYYRQTKFFIIGAASICVIISVSFAFISFDLILAGSAVGYIIIGISFITCAIKLPIGYSAKNSIKNIFINAIMFSVAFLCTNGLVCKNPSGYMSWLENALLIFSLNVILYLILMITFNRNTIIPVIKRLATISVRKLG